MGLFIARDEAARSRDDLLTRWMVCALAASPFTLGYEEVAPHCRWPTARLRRKARPLPSKKRAPGSRAFKRANRWVQSKDEVIAWFAQAGRPGDSVDDRMSLLVKAVTDRMTGPVEFQHYWSAREAFDYQSGDASLRAAYVGAVMEWRALDKLRRRAG
jgi:hypothetical protein